MTITPEQIDVWRTARSEAQNLEFKEAKTQFDNTKLNKYCVALANEGGGFLVLGISNKPPRRVVGSAAFNDPVAMAAKLFKAVGFRVEIEEVQHPDGRVVVFHIPSRPKGTAYHFEGSYLMRSGEELVPMSEDQLRKIFAEGQPSWLDEIAKKDLSGQDVIQLLDTQTFFDLLNLPYPTDQLGVLQRLESEKLIYSVNGNYGILNIGAVLLAKNLRNFEGVQRKAARVVVYEKDSKSQTESDITGEKGYAVGFKGLVQYVMGKLPQNEVIENAIRKAVKLVPEVVIRELLANALIHQDYEFIGMSPVVEIYSDRVEISNPGKPIVPVERFIDGYQSRNERLADLMRRFGICEEKSSGIDRVIETAEILQLPAPNFLVEHQRTVVVIFGPREFRAMDRSDRVRACYQHCVLQWVLRKKMTNQSLRDRFGLSERSGNTISQIISEAVQQELVKNDPSAPDSRKYARYIPAWA
ncbi:ATP-binding protein [Nitrosomonas ureae]|uniref:Predicted transcriptional regulator, contains HTH domain n=1 Tax=Nitrosomonas ureae TaxID=44577 RepID=A0A1H2E592_9PROT|nr:ATP-binding protein [Nitrosomonas ureae]ALQ50087.1 MloB [Nitrosomonas ureae]SDT90287.1 Predicted transcriptional regulator, contains HTH domain [Nitrosomonas ureae]